jgi:ribosomal protein S21
MSNISNRRITQFDFSKVSPIQVVVEGPSREDFEIAQRKFKALFQRERIIGQLKERSQYEKPSMKKRRKAREAKERALQNELREKLLATGEWERRQQSKTRKKLQKQERHAKEFLDV